MESVPNSLPDEDTINILDLLGIVIKRWRLIFWVTFATGAAILALNVYAMLAPADALFNFFPDFYAPEVKVRVQDAQTGSISSGGAGSEGSLSLLANLAGVSGTAPTDAELAQALLRGNALIDRVAEELDFETIIGETSTFRSASRSFFRNAISSEMDAKTGILTIRFKHVDRRFATDVLQYSLTLLEERFKELTMESVTVKKALIESRLEQVREERAAAESALIDFQSFWGIIDLETQARSQVADLASIKAAILSLEFEIETLREVRRSDDPEILRKQRELSALKEQLSLQERGGTIPTSPIFQQVTSLRLPLDSTVSRKRLSSNRLSTRRSASSTSWFASRKPIRLVSFRSSSKLKCRRRNRVPAGRGWSSL
jgi:hypothetical protein